MPARIIQAGWRRWSVLAPFILVAVSLSGCFSAKDPDEHCNDISEYQGSRSVSGIVVPDGLSPPSQVPRYAIPPAGTDAAAGDSAGGTLAAIQPDAACLSRPPDFFRRDPEPVAK